MASPQRVTVDQVRLILSEIIESLESPDYAPKLDEAKEAAGNEMLKMMQIVFPMVVQIEMETIKRHGFINSREGIVHVNQFHGGHFAVNWCKLASVQRISLHRSAMRRRQCYKLAVCACVLVYIYYFFGVGDYLLSRSYEGDFHYPLDVDLEPLVAEVLEGRKPSVAPINYYPHRFLTNSGLCSTLPKIDLFIAVKSAMGHFASRAAIRSTYGREDHVPGKVVRTLFFVGVGGSGTLQRRLEGEMALHKDIIQADFVDDYYNNTIKTMMTFRWLYEHCPNAEHCLFTDDDMYISAANLFQYLGSMKVPENGTERERRLLAGFYPWDRWPPYATAGAYVASSAALRALYAASLFVRHFRFDDVYLGIVARKLGLRPAHCPRFHFYKKPYSRAAYGDVIASHGYGDPDELLAVWNEQNPPA
ncbi:unnamed protein product, partial [Iphiclides podalirius]